MNGSESKSGRWDEALQESDLRHQAQDSWGDVAQLNKASEELSELTAALNRLQNGQQSRDDLLEEFIDAKLMMWQLELRFSDRELEDALDEALDDLEHRLEVYG